MMYSIKICCIIVSLQKVFVVPYSIFSLFRCELHSLLCIVSFTLNKLKAKKEKKNPLREKYCTLQPIATSVFSNS